VGGGADGSGAFAQDLACGDGVQAEDGAKQDGFGLVGGEGGDRSEAPGLAALRQRAADADV